ncbi:DUF4397 domain-containing protein [Vibrio sp. CAU 1672]|uniref:DUF4397 domain-containing protein n=1 Tax=Vibrio sp. CAU 1672 TaxID=3032594 RepID=UPI0023DB8A27|nr:DUF4397 domain-containing protein [Vibrio sp. CAU 1672]MDF2154387.1 DUF4397 domain-containing protein [Vibrio sp. CAU 1672]
MNKLQVAAVTVITALGITACGSDSDPVEYTYLQAVHASADAPRANVWVNDRQTLTDVDYGVGSGYLKLREGQNSVQVEVQLPGDDTLTVIERTMLDLDSELQYTVLVVGDADGSNNPVEPLIVTRSVDSMADENSLDVQVVHAASGVPAVDLYVTAPGAELASAIPLAYKASTEVINIPAGDYQIRLVAGETVAFDSGPLPLAANANLTIAAIKTADSNSSSPVQLLVLDGSGSTTLQDIGSAAEVRVGHLVDSAPVVDVHVNGGVFGPLADLAFKQIRGYLDLVPGSYDVDVFLNDTTSEPIISATGLSVEAGGDYSVYAVGSLIENVELEPLVVADERRAVATSAVLNVTHAAANPDASTVDIYLTTSSGIEGSDPVITDFAYKDSVQGVYVAEGAYFVTVTAAGDPSTVAIDSAPVAVTDGVVYQVVAIDDGNNGGFNLLVDDITD